MAILNNSNAISPSGYDVNNSLRFRASASAYLSRTPGSAGSTTLGTFSNWLKLGAISTDRMIYHVAGSSGNNNRFYITFNSDNTFQVIGYNSSGSIVLNLNTTQVFRDPSAWYHIVVAIDTTQATSSNRVKMYVNGSQITAFGTATYPSQNQALGFTNNTSSLIGSNQGVGNLFDGYLAETHFIDGSAKVASDFGETDATTGVWKPKAYSGTYGTNGFYLKFSDIATTSGSNAGLGKDFSGNTNYWTTNNISVTSGTTYDAMKDSPTNTSATVANYCVLSPLAGDVAPTNGNLYVTGVDKSTLGTVGVSSGKWYFEMTCVSNVATTNLDGVGIATRAVNNSAPDNVGYLYRSSGVKLQYGGSNTAYGASFTTGDVIGVAYDADAGTLVFYKNNVSQGTAFTGITGTLLPVVYARGITSTPTLALNFGQQPFIYTPPTGFLALNTYNLPDSTIKKGSSYMAALLYTGNGTNNRTVTGVGFNPSLTWVKSRSLANSHVLADSVRGTNANIYSNLTNAETAPTSSGGGGIGQVTTDGFTLVQGTVGFDNSNGNGATYVAWNWLAGTSSSSNTSGTITSTVSVNTTAGFSIVTWTGNGTNGTIGHGLGIAPSVIFAKIRSTTDNWLCYHSALGATKYINLNLTNAATTNAGPWNNTAPTPSVFSVSSTSVWLNNNGSTYVAYCWAAIAGYSAFTSYTGNGSTDGPFVYLGFRPKYVLIKVSSTTNSWEVFDTSRDTYNAGGLRLFAESSSAEVDSRPYIDILSNGFKLRSTGTGINGSGSTYIVAAWAEHPFKNSNAR